MHFFVRILDFATDLAAQPCSSGYLEGIKTLPHSNLQNSPNNVVQCLHDYKSYICNQSQKISFALRTKAMLEIQALEDPGRALFHQAYNVTGWSSIRRSQFYEKNIIFLKRSQSSTLGSTRTPLSYRDLLRLSQIALIGLLACTISKCPC